MAFTTLPSAGAKLRAAVLSALISETRVVSARKSSDETINNTSGYQDDDELFVPVEANATYVGWLHFNYLSQAAAAFKYQFTTPAGSNLPFWSFIGSSPFTYGGSAGGGVVGLAGTGANLPCDAWGLIIIGGTAGTMRMQWAQNVANASNTIVRAGSYLALWRLS